ncbi:MAG: hypothetical protein AAF843_04215 [Bacteroidota bacterium]
MEITEAFNNLDDELQDFLEFYNDTVTLDKMVYTFWDTKDILGHITFWHESFARNLNDLAEGRKPDVLKGRLSEVNKRSVESTRPISIDDLIDRLQAAHHTIKRYIHNGQITLIPYKQGSRSYSRLEHLQIVIAHIKRHLKDLRKAHRLKK